MLDLLMKRRSIRKYQEKKLSDDQINQIVKAGLLSPSGKRKNPWEFIVVTDSDILAELQNCKKRGSQPLENAPLAIVVIVDETKTDVWIEDVSIAAIIMQLQAESMGLGSCWVQIRKRIHNENITAEEFVKDKLSIPDKYRVETIIAIGYPAEEKPPHTEEELEYDKVFFNKFTVAYPL